MIISKGQYVFLEDKSIIEGWSGRGIASNDVYDDKSFCFVITPSGKIVQAIGGQLKPEREMAVQVGNFCHSFTDSWSLMHQFEVIGSASHNSFLCQMYSWLTGSPTDVIEFTTEWIIENCEIYETEREWREYSDAMLKEIK